MADIETTAAVTYTLSVTVKRAVRLVDDDCYSSSIDGAQEWMVGREAQRELKRELMQVLRKVDGDCDVEVMEAVRS